MSSIQQSIQQHVRIPGEVAGTPPEGTWTAERVEMLRSYASAGLTCLQIAEEIGVTRNAVIGKLNRLGLKGPRRARSRDPGSERPRRSQAFSQRRILRAICAEAREPAVVSPNPCTLMDLTCGTCRWPIGDADAKDFSFCGNPAAGDLPYCPGHARMAYRIPTQRQQ